MQRGRELTIGKLAKETGVKVVTIRYYETVGVLPAPSRTAGNYRTYNKDHAKRLQFIRRCRDLGFSLDQVRELLRLSSENAPSCSEVCRIADEHLRAIEFRVADLMRLASELRHISTSCNGRRPIADCRVMDALLRN